MSAKKRNSSSSRRVYLICGIVTFALLAVVFGIHSYEISKIAPVYQVKVNGLQAETPAEAQAACRAAYSSFTKAAEKHPDCAWVWAGKKTVYLVKPDAVELDAAEREDGFMAVKFKDAAGKSRTGYVIDPTTPPAELGRIVISSDTEYTFDKVSQTIRVGIRSGDINYENAVYLWEKDSDLVLAVRLDSYKIVEGSIVSFTDDGNVTHTCYILDTEI